MAITNADLENAVKRYVHIMEREGVNREVRLQLGSKVYGIAYRLSFVGDDDGNGSGHWGAYGTSSGLLGWTKREAFDTLHTICTAMEDLQYLQERRNASL